MCIICGNLEVVGEGLLCKECLDKVNTEYSEEIENDINSILCNIARSDSR